MYSGDYNILDTAEASYAGFGPYSDIALYNPLKYPSADPYLSDGEPLSTDTDTDFTISSPLSIAGGDDWSPPLTTQYQAPQYQGRSAFDDGDSVGPSDEVPQVNEEPADMDTDDHARGSGDSDSKADVVQTVCPADLYRDASESSLGLVDSSSDMPSNGSTTTPPAVEDTTTEQPAPARRCKKSKPKKGKTKERYSDLMQLDDAELLSRRPYGNWKFARPAGRRFKTRTLYILALPSGWEKLVEDDLPPSRLAALKAEVEADATAMFDKMGDRRVGTKEAKAVARVKAIVLGRLDCEIARKENRDPPDLPDDAQLPDDDEFERLRRQIRDRDWVSCVFCGKECLGREDAWYIERHAGESEKSGCPMLAVLVKKALIARWLETHVHSIHDHDLVQITHNSLTAASMPQSAQARALAASLSPSALAPAPTVAPPPRRTSSRDNTGTAQPAAEHSNIGPQRTAKASTRANPYRAARRRQ